MKRSQGPLGVFLSLFLPLQGPTRKGSVRRGFVRRPDARRVWPLTYVSFAKVARAGDSVSFPPDEKLSLAIHLLSS